jgi:hypothetical protein
VDGPIVLVAYYPFAGLRPVLDEVGVPKVCHGLPVGRVRPEVALHDLPVRVVAAHGSTFARLLIKP